MEAKQQELYAASTLMTRGATDGAATFLDRYRNNGGGTGGGGRPGGVTRAGMQRGAPLVDKHGNLI